MGGNRISHLGEPLHDNDAVRLSSANEFYLGRVTGQIGCTLTYP